MVDSRENTWAVPAKNGKEQTEPSTFTMHRRRYREHLRTKYRKRYPLETTQQHEKRIRQRMAQPVRLGDGCWSPERER